MVYDLLQTYKYYMLSAVLKLKLISKKLPLTLTYTAEKLLTNLLEILL